ncbi:hypothetical protein GUJ93_ZPchr0005g16225 [Zizania palustris]|uniref:Uncharacterized protein n=1 Tax=Zizania palustris TaxID=103762 RepID=A0A8J5W0J8_ZIZPA|nr:hypothetical protein GUJ93_ZPchr0005g16225 [Zizania palustris]
MLQQAELFQFRLRRQYYRLSSLGVGKSCEDGQIPIGQVPASESPAAAQQRDGRHSPTAKKEPIFSTGWDQHDILFEVSELDDHGVYAR